MQKKNKRQKRDESGDWKHVLAIYQIYIFYL